MTLEQLKLLIPRNPYQQQWYDALNQLFPQYDISTPVRQAAFIAQCAHESAGFTAITENLNYRWQSLRRVFPKYFPNDQLAQQYAAAANRQEAIANRVYANRMGNGDEQSGDGYRYRGRGLIQLTGRTNYEWFAASLQISVAEAVDYLQTFEGAAQSACWFWDTNNLNPLADARDIVGLTKRINGGTNGLQDRIQHFEHALHVLGA